MSKPVVLFLAANPKGTTELALTEECAAINRELKMTPGRTSFDFQTRWAVTVDDLMRELNESSPALIHFAGHGNAEGIALLSDDGATHLLSSQSLVELIASAGGTTRAVILNACYSDEQARVLCEEVGCAIGMKGPVSDEAARFFSVAFYRAIGNGRSVYNAFRQAKAALAAKGMDQRAAPRCLTRADVDAGAILLRSTTEPPPPPAPPPTTPAVESPRSTPEGQVINQAGRDILQFGNIQAGEGGSNSFDFSRRK